MVKRWRSCRNRCVTVKLKGDEDGGGVDSAGQKVKGESRGTCRACTAARGGMLTAEPLCVCSQRQRRGEIFSCRNTARGVAPRRNVTGFWKVAGLESSGLGNKLTWPQKCKPVSYSAPPQTSFFRLFFFLTKDVRCELLTDPEFSERRIEMVRQARISSSQQVNIPELWLGYWRVCVCVCVWQIEGHNMLSIRSPWKSLVWSF